MKIQDWYTDWFNTPYYHILYKERNDKDAQLFMKSITSFLKLPKTTHILDLPCGKGRHSLFLNTQKNKEKKLVNTSQQDLFH